MKRTSLTGPVAAALLASAGSITAGCGFIVGAGDYSVGSPEASAGTGSEAGSEAGSADAPTPSGATIGDPCIAQSDCAKGQCNGTWCEQACTPATGCGNNSLGVPNQCVAGPGSSDICFPGCTSNADCLLFAGALTCQTVAGMSVCKSAPGAIGDPCTTSSQCTQGSCMSGIPWCTAACSLAVATCGSSSTGEESYCVENANNAYICFAGCTTGGDCSAFPGTTCQPIAGSTTGSICSAPPTTGGFIGDPCAAASDCTEGTCMAPNIVWCTEACTVDSDCQGNDSAGNPTYCVLNRAGNQVCFPGCTTNADCTGYSVTLTCQPNASEAGTMICSD